MKSKLTKAPNTASREIMIWSGHWGKLTQRRMTRLPWKKMRYAVQSKNLLWGMSSMFITLDMQGTSV